MARPPQLLSRKSYDIEVNALLRLFDSHERGQIVTYVEMEQASKLDRKVDKNVWGLVINRVRKKLLENRGIAIRSVNNVGYRMLTAQEQVRDQRHEKSAARKIRMGGTEKALVNPDELSSHDKNIQVALVFQAHQGGDMLRRQAAERKSFLAHNETVNQFNKIHGLQNRAVIAPSEPELDKKDKK